MPTKTPRERFDEQFPCIQHGCDNNGTVAVQVSEDDWEPQQCQYCYEHRLPMWSLVETLLEEARKEERAKNEKIQNAYGVYVADTMDGVEPEEAYKHMTKTIDSISLL